MFCFYKFKIHLFSNLKFSKEFYVEFVFELKYRMERVAIKAREILSETIEAAAVVAAVATEIDTVIRGDGDQGNVFELYFLNPNNKLRIKKDNVLNMKCYLNFSLLCFDQVSINLSVRKYKSNTISLHFKCVFKYHYVVFGVDIHSVSIIGF